MKKRLTEITTIHRFPFIIAIDASLGKPESIGSLITAAGALEPGSALHKNLPPIGDIHISGIVNIQGLLEHTILQNTRLSVVYPLAEKITQIMMGVDSYLRRSKLPTIMFHE